MVRYNNAPVPPDKIQLIQDLLNDPHVKEAWLQYTRLNEIASNSAKSHVKARMEAWHNYVLLRDQFLGLPTQNKYFLEGIIYGK